MNTETQIIVGEIHGTLSLAPNAEAIRAELLAAADAFTAPPKDATGLEAMVEVRRKVNAMEKGVEKTREELNAPILKQQRDLKKMGDDFRAPLIKACSKLDGFINFFQREQLRLTEEARQQAERKQREAEEQARRAQEEVARLEREKAEAKAREDAAVAEAKRQLEEAARLKDREAQETALEAARVAEEQANTARAQQEAAEEAALKAELAAEVVDFSPAMPPAPVQLKGVNTKTRLDYRIAGKNDYEKKASLLKLAAKYPHLVNIEIRRADTLSVLNEQNITDLPGLEVFTDTSTRIR